MTDEELNNLMHQLHLATRKKTTAKCFVGNDTQCFTEEQYIEAWFNQRRGNRDSEIEAREKAWWRRGGMARKHLTAAGMVEVKPGVWTMPNKDLDK